MTKIWLAAVGGAALAFAAGCGVGRYVQLGIDDYDRADYVAAMDRFEDLAPHQTELNDKGLARYLAYRGLTEYRLGARDAARDHLLRARAVMARTAPGLVSGKALREIDEALTDLGPGPVVVAA
ncbi:MAG TPA: hypothetical protein VHB21_26585, partial [Minicystis sp.]|nr:hypothetical protein [Minicystis sp.]